MRYSLKAKYLACGSRQAKDGKTYYNITVMQGSETASLGVTDELFMKINNDGIQMGDECEFDVTPSARSGGQYGSFLSLYCRDYTVLA